MAFLAFLAIKISVGINIFFSAASSDPEEIPVYQVSLL